MPADESVAWERTACPLCSAEESVLYRRAPDRLYGCEGEFSLVRCRVCGHFYLNPRPTPECIGRFYPEQYGPHHASTPAQQNADQQESSGERPARPWYLSSWARALPGLRRLYYWLKESHADFVPVVETASPQALELGCADGRFLEHLRERGWQPSGIELIDAPAQVARDKGFEVHAGVLDADCFAEQPFDAVFAWMLLEHVPEPRETLTQIHRVLKPGGWLVISVPNFACWEPFVFRSYWYSLQLPTHLQHFTPRTLRRLLDESGFESIRVIHQHNVFNLVGSLGLWLRTRFPSLSLGQRMLRFTDAPTMWGQLALAPLAKLLAWLHQGGRLTVVARRRRDAMENSQ